MTTFWGNFFSRFICDKNNRDSGGERVRTQWKFMKENCLKSCVKGGGERVRTQWTSIIVKIIKCLSTQILPFIILIIFIDTNLRS